MAKIFLIFFFITLAFAEDGEKWKENLMKNLSSNQRLAFAEVPFESINNDIISEVKSKARIELSKTFVVSLSSSSKNTSNYKQEGSETTINTKTYSSYGREETIDVELIGVNSNNINVDEKRKIITASAIIDLDQYFNHLKELITQIKTEVDHSYSHFNCQSVKSLNKLRSLKTKMLDGQKYIKWASSFAQISSLPIQNFSSYLDKVAYCQSGFNFQFQNLSENDQAKLARILTDEGFKIGQKNKFLEKNISIKIKYQLSPAEFIHNQYTATGKIFLYITNVDVGEILWATDTLRTIDHSKERTEERLKIKLMLETSSRFRKIIQENF